MTTETTWRLDGRTAIITGAAGLIGSALSAGFAANGAHVVMVDRDGDGLARLAAELGGSVTCVECDVTDLGAIDEMARDVVRRFGAVDVLVVDRTTFLVAVSGYQPTWRRYLGHLVARYDDALYDGVHDDTDEVYAAETHATRPDAGRSRNP